MARMSAIPILAVALGAALAAAALVAQPGEPPSPPPAPPPGVERPEFKPPEPRAAGERADERLRMVEEQIAHPADGRDPVRDERVLAALRAVPRHAFVRSSESRKAYDDDPLPIGHDQTISQPYIVAIMTELLELDENDKVLEIGTGSGYQAAVLAHLTPEVYTVEIVAPLARRARETLRDQGYGGVRCLEGDGYFGWAEHAPFDAIIVTCAAGHLPLPLWKQLRPGGRLIVPLGGPYETQRLIVMTKELDGTRRSRSVAGVTFVPMTGRVRD